MVERLVVAYSRADDCDAAQGGTEGGQVIGGSVAQDQIQRVQMRTTFMGRMECDVGLALLVREVYEEQIQLFGHQLRGPLRGRVRTADPQGLGRMLGGPGGREERYWNSGLHFRFGRP